VDTWLGDETGREQIPQLLDNARRPRSVEPLPRRFLAHRRSKVITKRHKRPLRRHCSWHPLKSLPEEQIEIDKSSRLALKARPVANGFCPQFRHRRTIFQIVVMMSIAGRT
jgi:hypothetical protein